MNTAMPWVIQKAYELLLSAGVRQLPVDVESLIRSLPQVSLMTYRQAARIMDMTEEALSWEFPSQDAFTLRKQANGVCQYLICYQQSMPPARRRFSLAHELAHVILEHPREGEQENAQANCFAQHLLLPRPLVRRMAQASTPLPLNWVCKTAGLSAACVRQILSHPSPAAQDPDTEKELAQQMNQLFNPIMGKSAFIDPTPYLTTL